jgi:hypothetical protein
MVFSDTSTNQGIIQDITFLLGVDINAYPIQDRTRNVNSRLDLVWSIIMDSSSGWLVDDKNSEFYLTQSISAPAGQYSFQLPANIMTVISISFAYGDPAETWNLEPMTMQEIQDMGGFDNVVVPGRPKYYTLSGGLVTIFPYQASTDATESLLRVTCDNTLQRFVYTDTTLTPGFDEPFHRMLSVGAALDYAIARGSDKRAELQNLWNDYEGRLRKFYAKKWKDRQPAKIRKNRYSLDWMT